MKRKKFYIVQGEEKFRENVSYKGCRESCKVVLQIGFQFDSKPDISVDEFVNSFIIQISKSSDKENSDE